MRRIERNGYYRSGNSYSNRYPLSSKRSRSAIRNLSVNRVQKMANQFIVSCIIALLVIILANFNTPFINKVVGRVRWAVGENYDFKQSEELVKNKLMPEITEKIKSAYGTVENIFNQSNVDDVSSSNTTSMIMPVDGEIKLGFGTRKDPTTSEMTTHDGLDIAGENGMPIKAALDGVVVEINQNDEMGRYVILEHDDGIETVYGRCSEILVKENQYVNQGDYIAKIGDTGEAEEGAYLHFKVLKDGKPVDPADMINDIVENM